MVNGDVGEIPNPAVWTQKGIAGLPPRYARLFPTRKGYQMGVRMMRDIPQMISISIDGDDRSMKKMMRLFQKMAKRYTYIVWSEYKKALPELHAKAGEYAEKSGTPWSVLGRYAIATTVPANAPSAITQSGPAINELSQSSMTAGMGTRWVHPSKSGRISSMHFGAEQMIGGSVGATGRFAYGKQASPIGFAFKLFGSGLMQREAGMEGGTIPTEGGSITGTGRGHLWADVYNAEVGSGWAIPQPGFEGSMLGPSPWFTGANWRNKSGHKYPHANWLWREELGLAGTETAAAVKEALETIGVSNLWPVPTYTKYRLKGGGKRSGGVFGPVSIMGGMEVGLHWVPPRRGERNRNQLKLGPGIMPKFFMRAATIEMTQVVAARCMKRLGEEYQRMSNADRARFNKATALLPAAMKPRVTVTQKSLFAGV